MAIELTQEQLRITSNSLRNEDSNAGDYSRHMESRIIEEELLGVRERLFGPSHEYELNKSESLTFLYNLLYDENSILSKSDILGVLNSLKLREDNLEFAITSLRNSDIQGVKWPIGLKEKFKQDRLRLGMNSWFHNISGSRERARRSVTLNDAKITTDFYKFYKFFTKLKLHITHFQLRNLIATNSNISNGIYYPLSHYHDHNLETINNYNDDDYHTFFKVNRLMPDNLDYHNSDSSKLDCIIDSRNLKKNSNNRISTLACSNNILACGTFEGGYILEDIADPDSPKLIGEYHLTNSSDGITNHISINDNDDIIVLSNDKSIRVVDIMNRAKYSEKLPFAVNCSSLNPFGQNELLITGDHLDSFVLDLRQPFKMQNLQEFKGHEDYGFSCDWSPKNENLLITGNQDGTVKLWDRRNSLKSVHSWDGSLGTSVPVSGPIRNCKFSYHGDYICWAESLDHVGIIEVDELLKGNQLERVQSIDFIGKCIGMGLCPIDSGFGEQLVIGINDCPLGGILSYKLESKYKTLDFDFAF